MTHPPEIVDGEMLVPTRPGWGSDVNEEVVRARALQARERRLGHLPRADEQHALVAERLEHLGRQLHADAGDRHLARAQPRLAASRSVPRVGTPAAWVQRPGNKRVCAGDTGR